MEGKDPYIIVEAFDSKELAGYVNAKIKNGYVPTGGICVDHPTGAYDPFQRICQAMVHRTIYLPRSASTGTK